MIVAVTPNPAWDVTYRAPVLRVGETHRVVVAGERAGGKGLNTAGVLVAMAVPVTAVAPVGRDGLDAVAGDLDARGIPHRLVEVPGTTRRSTTVVDDDGAATVLNEVGAPLPEETAVRLARLVATTAGPGDVVTVSGSLPPDTPTTLVRDVTAAARGAGARAVLDVRGEALLDALPLAPDVVTPNRAEAGELLGSPGASTADLARGLVARGARAAVVSDGPAGLVLVHGSTVLSARPDAPVRGNPTGAGDALTAALAASLAEADDLPDGVDAWSVVLRRAVAWSAAAVLQPLAGHVDPGDVRRLEALVRVERLAER